MCGIFGYIGNKTNSAQIVLAGLKTLEYRGYDSWGIAVASSKLKSKDIIIKKRVGKIKDASVSDLPQSCIALGHTRWATHGGVTKVNAHPHLDCTGTLAIIHNGIIENYDEIKKEMVHKGHRLISETDTEVAVHLIEQNIKDLSSKDSLYNEVLKEAVRSAFNTFEGLSAIIVIDAKTNTFVAAKNGSPLVIGRGKNENLLASDAHALLPYTKEVYFIKDGDLVYISQENIEVINTSDGKEKHIAFTTLDWDIQSVTKGKFSHFMEKEIYDQPDVLQNINNDSSNSIEKLASIIKKSYGTYLVGCGTAAYACLAGTYIFSKIAKRHVNFAVGSEFGYLVDFLTPKSFVLALSQSGETIDVIDAINKAKEKGARIGTLVNVLGSTLYRIADYKMLLQAGVEKAVVTTKAFTAKLAILIKLGYELSGDGRSGDDVIKKAISVTKNILQDIYIKDIKSLAKKLVHKEHIYIIGRGVSYPIALETALKIKEASYIHAEGFAAGELKHGVIALVEKNTPCIAYLPNDETYGANLAGAMEMKARGGFIIGISYKPHEVFDYYLPVRDCGIASIIPSIVVGQLLGYFLAIERGIDPDQPRNLAKSVTVK